MFKKAAVAYNNVFRKLLGIKRGESISAIYATSNIDAFQVLNRKSLYSFMNRLSLSDNIITSPPEGVARYCFHPVCACVCLSVCLSVCLCVCVSVCPANILVFYFSAIRRYIDLKFIQDIYMVVLNSLT